MRAAWIAFGLAVTAGCPRPAPPEAPPGEEAREAPQGRREAPAPVEPAHDLEEAQARAIRALAGIGARGRALGALGEARGGTDEVRRLGALVADDHARLQERTAKLLEGRDVVAEVGEGRFPELERGDAAAFDSAWLTELHTFGEDAVEVLRELAAAAGDPAITEVVEAYVPLLEQHRVLAQELLDEDGPT